MKATTKAVLALCAAVYLVASNPRPAEHRAALAETVQAAHPIASLFGVAKVAGALLEYRSYYLFSVGRVGGELVTLGAVGRVWTSAKS